MNLYRWVMLDAFVPVSCVSLDCFFMCQATTNPFNCTNLELSVSGNQVSYQFPLSREAINYLCGEALRVSNEELPLICPSPSTATAKNFDDCLPSLLKNKRV
jgi:hypothetical protein